MANLLEKIFGTANERRLKELWQYVYEINDLEPSIQKLSDTALRAKTDEFKKRIEDGEDIDDLLPEAFAVVREAAKRVLGLRPFDVQLIGGIVLHQGDIAEMKTGEGKTLVATLPAYLNGLTGKGVHIITVNDYLANRDRHWMGPVYEFLGLTVGLIQHDSTPEDRQKAYAADITYGTNNEFGFDYLRDNMAVNAEYVVQRSLSFCIVDEVDSILIDEARTPLIISGPAEENVEIYSVARRVASSLKIDEDYTVEEKTKSVIITETGISNIEKMLNIKNLYEMEYVELLHCIHQAIRAKELYKRDVDYIVKEGKVIIVDEFTGRLMEGRRFGEGLHQAIEAKERVKVERENQTLATITFQNYFRMYEKLSGMTGTADTEAEEFKEIYNLNVVVIPTNLPMIRKDHEDIIYKTQVIKFKAIVNEIEEMHKIGRPVLVGTTSVEKSERLSHMLKKRGIMHQVLNAKYHEQEAEIISRAGERNAVTIATNMAGRGTDIKLGEGVADLGGLHVIGSERHESRRIDNQLRGRSGRQGDNGSTRFFVALDDDLMRMFGSERISSLMSRLKIPEDEPIQHPWISKAIERAQKQVEGYNFDLRKNLIDYDNVMNTQREVIYKQRRMVLDNADLTEHINEMIETVLETELIELTNDEDDSSEWDWKALQKGIKALFGIEFDIYEFSSKKMKVDEFYDILLDKIKHYYQYRENIIGTESLREIEHYVILSVVDNLWKEHLHNIDYLKEGINLRAYAQQNPITEYKKEAFYLFEELVYNIQKETITFLLRGNFTPQLRQKPAKPPKKSKHRTKQTISLSNAKSAQHKTKIRPDDPCPCGSGKKYKNCHGKNKI